jgi:type II secretory pathway component PulM
MTPRDRRALALGGAAIAAAVVLLRIVPWGFRAVGHLREEAIEQSGTVARARDVLSRTPLVRDSLSAVLAAIVGLAPQLVDGRSAADAQAGLSGLVTLVANRHNLKIVRLEALPDSAVGVFSPVRLHAELEGDVRGAAVLLRSIETGDPLLTVTSLAIAAPDPAATVEALHIEMDVAGYYLPRGEAAP